MASLCCLRMLFPSVVRSLIVDAALPSLDPQMVNRGAVAGMEGVDSMSKEEMLGMLRFGADRIFQVGEGGWVGGQGPKGWSSARRPGA